MVGAGAALYAIPLAFSTPPLIKDSLVTATSSAQDENIQETLPLITAIAGSTRHPFEYNEYGVPRLDRLRHIDFLKNGLEDFPASFVSIDASRPWMVYWGLMGLYLLGEDVTQYRTRLVPLALLFHLGGSRPHRHQIAFSNRILMFDPVSSRRSRQCKTLPAGLVADMGSIHT
jgi:hypothetical protein